MRITNNGLLKWPIPLVALPNPPSVEPITPDAVQCQFHFSFEELGRPSINLLPVDQGEEFVSGLRALPHSAEHAAGCCRRAGFLHAAHDHAHVCGFHDYGDTLRLEHFLERQRNLLGQTFLDLKTPAEHFGDTSEFGKTNDTAGWDVSNVHLQEALVNGLADIAQSKPNSPFQRTAPSGAHTDCTPRCPLR